MRVKALETILVLVLALLAGYYFNKSPYWLVGAALLIAITLLIPALAEKIHVGWMKLGEGMGFITSKIILTLIFFLILVPLSWIAALFRKPVMKMKPGADSFFKSRNVTYTAQSMKDMW
jgi:hydrogenase-4 membrane subunit HyfE